MASSTSKREIVARRQHFISDLLHTCTCHPMVASIMYTHQQSLVQTRRIPRFRQPTVFAVHPKDYVRFSTAENVLRLEAMGYDLFEAYVFLSSAENVDRSKLPLPVLEAYT